MNSKVLLVVAAVPGQHVLTIHLLQLQRGREVFVVAHGGGYVILRAHGGGGLEGKGGRLGGG